MVSHSFFVGAWYVDEFVRTERMAYQRNEECSYFYNLPLILKLKNKKNTQKFKTIFIIIWVLPAAITLHFMPPGKPGPGTMAGVSHWPHLPEISRY